VTDETLIHEITSFLDSGPARAICRRYDADPMSAAGDLWLRLSPRAGQSILNPTAWVRANATGLLRNFLRSEHSRLHQCEEHRA
jgi:hypothetical protein